FVYGREIYRDRFQRSIRLLAEHHDTAAIAGLQDAARFRDCFGYRQATRHQLDSRSPDVADHAVAIRTRLIERDRHLRIDDVFVFASEVTSGFFGLSLSFSSLASTDLSDEVPMALSVAFVPDVAGWVPSVDVRRCRVELFGDCANVVTVIASTIARTRV